MWLKYNRLWLFQQVHHHPLWLQATSEDFLTCLSVHSLSHLNNAMQPLKLFPLHLKATAMQAIVKDLLQEQVQFSSCDSTCSMFLQLIISHHFNSQYGQRVANALQDIQKPNDFSMQHIHVNHSLLYGQSWLSHSYNIMFLHFMDISKQDMLDCLHLILSYLRPSYNTQSACSCCSVLLHHIQVHISYFASLTEFQFLSLFLSVFPYDEYYQSACSLLTEHLLCVKYDEGLISYLCTPTLSVNETWCVQQCTNQALVVMDAKHKIEQFCSTGLLSSLTISYLNVWQHETTAITPFGSHLISVVFVDCYMPHAEHKHR